MSETAYLPVDEGEGRDRESLLLQPYQAKLWQARLACCTPCSAAALCERRQLWLGSPMRTWPPVFSSPCYLLSRPAARGGCQQQAAGGGADPRRPAGRV